MFDSRFIFLGATILSSVSAFAFQLASQQRYHEGAGFLSSNAPMSIHKLRLQANEQANDGNENKSVTTATAVERCYEAWNHRDMNRAVQYFEQDFEYDDTQYIGRIKNKSTLRRCLEQRVESLPTQSKMVVDDMASCSKTGNIGTRWHVEREDGSVVPFTNGCSFYTTNTESGLITSAFKTSEMIVKPSQNVIDGIVSSAARFMGNSDSSTMSTYMSTTASSKSTTASESSSTQSSIIEQYFEAWNKRDMEAALNCFVDECTYQTEDPLFVGILRGKADLERHLVQNAASLPSACQIILDDLAIDDSSSSNGNGNGNIGVKWHLEVNGVRIPNLRGCSMYSTDTSTGLLKSGYDVTEQPVKLPQVAMGILSLPSKLGML